MKKLLIFSSFIIFAICLQAQKMEFSIQAGGSYLPKTAERYTTKTSSSIFTPINDSLALISRYESTLINESINTPNPSYYINGQLKFNLSNRVAISTGWGIETLSFNNKSEEIDFQRGDLIEQNTVPTFNSGSGTFSSFCDIYTNNFTDLEDQIDGTNLSFIYLRIPLEIYYEVIPHLAYVKTGVSLNTPIYTKEVSDFITINRETNNGINHCTYEYLESIDESGSRINKALLGASLTLGCKITPRINIEIGANRTLNNLFENRPNSFNNASFNPLRLNAGVSYVFGNDTNE